MTGDESMGFGWTPRVANWALKSKPLTPRKLTAEPGTCSVLCRLACVKNSCSTQSPRTAANRFANLEWPHNHKTWQRAEKHKVNNNPTTDTHPPQSPLHRCRHPSTLQHAEADPPEAPSQLPYQQRLRRRTQPGHLTRFPSRHCRKHRGTLPPPTPQPCRVPLTPRRAAKASRSHSRIFRAAGVVPRQRPGSGRVSTDVQPPPAIPAARRIEEKQRQNHTRIVGNDELPLERTTPAGVI